MQTYASRFHLLLHLEEIQMEVDIRKYDLLSQPMTPDQHNNNLLILKVSGEDDHMLPVRPLFYCSVFMF